MVKPHMAALRVPRATSAALVVDDGLGIDSTRALSSPRKPHARGNV
jgi:hypothetical protein